MKQIFTVAIMSIPASIFAGASAYMAIHGIEKWGWFIFAAIVLAVGRAKSDDKDDVK